MKKMVMAVISRDQADVVLDRLIRAGHGATFTESRGGVLRQAQQMLFVAVDEEKVDDVLGIIQKYCRTEVSVGGESDEERGTFGGHAPATAQLGHAVVFVWDLERFDTY